MVGGPTRPWVNGGFRVTQGSHGPITATQRGSQVIYLAVKALCPPSTGSGNRGEVCADRTLGWRDLTKSCQTEHPVRTGSRRVGEGSYAPGKCRAMMPPALPLGVTATAPCSSSDAFPPDSWTVHSHSEMPTCLADRKGGRLHPKTQALRCVCPRHPTPASAPSTLQCHSHGTISARLWCAINPPRPPGPAPLLRGGSSSVHPTQLVLGRGDTSQASR